jgi:hypothetical protein
MQFRSRKQLMKKLKIKTIQSISVQNWDDFVEATYGRPYSFQQQDGCKDRGTFNFTVPSDGEDFENDIIPEEVNGEEMGVSFKAWLARDPKQKLNSKDKWDRDHGLFLFWERNFYPHVDMIINDLHAKGLLPEGEYQIVIDW